jgi:hypothetical protein
MVDVDTTIYLEILKSDTVPVPKDPDEIPWCLALATHRSQPGLPRAGNRKKMRHYYYRYTGGNTTWDDDDDDDLVNDGDFEFIRATGVKTIDVVFHNKTKGWQFDRVKDLVSGGPVKLLKLVTDKVKLADDTDNLTNISGYFGVVAKRGKLEIYCDPNWDNR